MHFPQIHGGLSGKGSPSGRAGERSETERARPLTANPRHCDSIALTKSLPIAAQQLFPAGLALSVTFGDTARVAAPSIRRAPLASCWPLPQQLLPVSATGGGRRRCSQRERLWLAASFPVSFWQKEWYNGFAALPAHFMGREVKPNGVYFYLYPVRRSECSVLLHLQVA